MSAAARCTAFDPFEFETRWVAWRNAVRNGKQTKVPYSPHGGPAKADDPSTWSTRSAAEAKARNLANGEDGGIGIELGDLGDGTSLGGIDLDTCLFGGMFEQWAMDIIQRLGSYAEVSPSGTGAKILFRYLTEDLPKLRAEMGGAQHGKMFKRPNGLDHPPAIELHLTNRYFATTEQRLGWTPDRIITVPTEHLLWVLKEAGPAFAGTAFAGGRSKAGGNSDKSRSATAFRKGCALRRAGKTFKEMVEALRADPETAAWCREKGDANGGRELQRIWDKAGVAEEAAGVTLADFYAYMPMHNYIFIPTRALWPIGSINALFPRSRSVRARRLSPAPGSTRTGASSK